MKFIENTDWRNEMITIGYHATTQIDQQENVSVEVHGTCGDNGWFDRFIVELKTDRELFHNGDKTAHIPELDKLLDKLDDLI